MLSFQCIVCFCHRKVPKLDPRHCSRLPHRSIHAFVKKCRNMTSCHEIVSMTFKPMKGKCWIVEAVKYASILNNRFSQGDALKDSMFM